MNSSQTRPDLVGFWTVIKGQQQIFPRFSATTERCNFADKTFTLKEHFDPSCFVTVTYFWLWGQPLFAPQVIVNPLSCNHVAHLCVISTLICPFSLPPTSHVEKQYSVKRRVWRSSQEQKVSTFPAKEAAPRKEREQKEEEIMWVLSSSHFVWPYSHGNNRLL